MKKYLVFSIFLLFILSSCSVDNSLINIVGRWHTTDYPEHDAVFTHDGKFYLYDKNGELGDYGLIGADNDYVYMKFESPCTECNLKLRYSLSSDSLIFIFDWGSIQYKRIE